MSSSEICLLATNGHYGYFPLDYFLERQASLGFTAIELTLTAPQVLVDWKSGVEGNALRSVIERYGLRVAAVRPENASRRYMPFAADGDGTLRSKLYYARCAGIARELGAEVLSIAPLGAFLDEEPERAFDRAVRLLNDLCRTVFDCGIKLAVESLCPKDSVIANTLPALRMLINAAAHTSLVAALDIVPMSEAGETIAQWFDAFGDSLQYIRFSDGRTGGEHFVCGTGVYPIERYLSQIRTCGYHGFIALPLSTACAQDPATADRQNWEALAAYRTSMGGDVP